MKRSRSPDTYSEMPHAGNLADDGMLSSFMSRLSLCSRQPVTICYMRTHLPLSRNVTDPDVLSKVTQNHESEEGR